MSIIVSENQKRNRNSSRFFEEDRDFARATFEAFGPYISHDCWGINKRHTITKAEWVARTQWCEERNRGVEKPMIVIRDEKGEPWLNEQDQPIFFNYYLNYKRKVWTLDVIPPALNGEELHYYMSPAKSGKKLAYLDLDDHEEWQDDLPDAIDLLKELFTDRPYYRYSHGGYNAWLKIGDAPTAKEYNAGLARLERVLKDVFAQRRIKSTIEIKGRSVWGEVRTFDDRRSHLAKLPYWNHRYPCNQRDADDKWSYPRLREFRAKPDLRWKSLMAAVDQLEQMLDPVKVEDGKRYLESLKNGGKVVVVEGSKAAVAEKAPAVPKPPARDQEVTPLSATLRVASAPLGRGTNGDLGLTPGSPRTLDQIRQITDAFVRNREFALFAARLARRPLTADELLEQDRQHHIHNGEWKDGLAERKRRYRQIAPFVARTFDPDKCGKVESQRPILDANLREWKAKAHLFPKIAIGNVGKRSKKIERPVLIALAAIIQTASKPDRDCPRDSIQGWWEELAAEDQLPAWSVDLYVAARRVLLRYRIIAIDHKRWQYVPDAKGQCKGIWIKEQDLVGERNYRFPSTSLYCLLLSLRLHKGYGVDMSKESGWSSQISESRPPP
jgi:hypothetical protein